MLLRKHECIVDLYTVFLDDFTPGKASLLLIKCFLACMDTDYSGLAFIATEYSILNFIHKLSPLVKNTVSLKYDIR